MKRRDRMSQALFSVGPQGKRVLESIGIEGVTLERKAPIQIEHFTALNDLRISAELTGSLSYFFASWELPGCGWSHPLIPDAIFAMGDRTFALEFDRGLEGIQFFIRTKITAYQRGLQGFPLSAVVVIADSDARMKSLARAICGLCRDVIFSTLVA